MTNAQQYLDDSIALADRVSPDAHRRRRRRRGTLATAAVVALVATACGTTATSSSPAAESPTKEEAVDTGPRLTVPTPVLTVPPTTLPPAPATTEAPALTVPPTTAPPTTAPPTTAPPVPPKTVPPKIAPSPTPEPRPDPLPTDLVVGPVITIAPTATLPPVYVAPAAACGTFAAIPSAAQVTSDLAVDIDGDGAADDQVITYLDGTYKLRTVVDGMVSELDVPDVGVSSIRALGVGNLGELSAGNEIVAQTGAGASAARISFYGHDADGCLFEFTRYGAPLDVYVGATIGTSSGAACGESYIGQWEYSLDDDGTYFGSSAAYFESTPGDFTYLPASDDFSEGLTADQLSPAHLDCFDFGL